MCVGVAGVDHNADDCGRGIEGAEGKLVALRLEERNHCVKVINVESHAEEAEILNHVVTHQIHVIAVGVHQNVVLHKIGGEVVSHLQIKAFAQNLNSELGILSCEYGIARRYHKIVLLCGELKLLSDIKNRQYSPVFDIGTPIIAHAALQMCYKFGLKNKFFEIFLNFFDFF
jgi:hypothetical protein